MKFKQLLALALMSVNTLPLFSAYGTGYSQVALERPAGTFYETPAPAQGGNGGNIVISVKDDKKPTTMPTREEVEAARQAREAEETFAY